MDYVYRFVWAAVAAFLTTLLLIKLGACLNLTDWLFFPSVLDFLHAHGWSARVWSFWLLFLIYWITEWHFVIGGILLNIIFTIIWIIVVIVAVYVGWNILIWLASLL